MNWFGASIVLVATTWAGWEWSNRLKQRPQQIRQLKTFLQALEAEVTFGLTPIDEACDKLAAQCDPPLSTFISDFSNRLKQGGYQAERAWEEALNELWTRTSLKKSEKEILTQFGQTLGVYGRTEQKKQIMLALTHLEREEAEARDELKRFEKLFRSLGLLTGLLLVLLLI
ncbi:stage III sporulation protein SpoIIIAB [Salsuginibacillus kocurii]|uniref:stage III sporulation protein SpoIIIAB n=1 Tax=Salsuginibacillus kocurii TaxID=427078 RepID=UPI00036B4DE2|nr:stage III sporulation protein SpoIIIAB [Salsuginibacillus kocurii]